MGRNDIKIGDRYGMLTIVSEVEPTLGVNHNGFKRSIWNVQCLCDCGNTKILHFQGLKKGVKKGSIPSCGCVMKNRIVNTEGFERDHTIKNISIEDKRIIVKKMILEGCRNKQIISKTGYSESFISKLRKGLGLNHYTIDKIEIGRKFGKLTVVGIDENNMTKHRKVLCDCECGTKNKSIGYSNIKNGDTVSCGCYVRSLAKKMMDEKILPTMIKHGDSRKDSNHYYIFQVWMSAKQRCYNPNNKRYNSYGELGITMYDEWIKNYPLFKKYILTNLGEKPEGKSKSRGDSYSMDRINVTKGYEPDNLRWASFEVQMNNKQRHHN
jgi:uncharacterized protein YerC